MSGIGSTRYEGSFPGREDQLALSEYEQRKLDEIERSLRSDDPALATILDSEVIRRHRRGDAVVIFVGGLVALIGGAVSTLSPPVFGVVDQRPGVRCDGGWRRVVRLGSRLASRSSDPA